MTIKNETEKELNKNKLFKVKMALENLDYVSEKEENDIIESLSNLSKEDLKLE